MSVSAISSIIKQRGFSLIESVIAIVLTSIVMVGMSTFMFPAVKQMGDPIAQMRSAEIANAALQEVFSRSFDQNSDHAGGVVRCGELTITCTTTAALGKDTGETNKISYNDVDDFITGAANLCGANSDFVTPSTIIGTTPAIYDNFSLCIQVTYPANNLDGSANNQTLLKHVNVVVKTPQGSEYSFSAYRSNF
ncbi:MAG: type II secretion system protein [Aliivibrio sp.]|uniref:type IV pilus modification PilV family protein n=1 Tax=Aliivibrio sp. TaxID=1872443 RepID=UPI001A40BA93|nr:type II secretion system protein [Aliivibrio sp.]